MKAHSRLRARLQPIMSGVTTPIIGERFHSVDHAPRQPQPSASQNSPSPAGGSAAARKAMKASADGHCVTSTTRTEACTASGIWLDLPPGASTLPT